MASSMTDGTNVAADDRLADLMWETDPAIFAFIYGDLPVWDLLFGTFRNPRHFDGEVGFYDGGSKRLGAMLHWEVRFQVGRQSSGMFQIATMP